MPLLISPWDSLCCWGLVRHHCCGWWHPDMQRQLYIKPITSFWKTTSLFQRASFLSWISGWEIIPLQKKYHISLQIPTLWKEELPRPEHHIRNKTIVQGGIYNKANFTASLWDWGERMNSWLHPGPQVATSHLKLVISWWAMSVLRPYKSANYAW